MYGLILSLLTYLQLSCIEKQCFILNNVKKKDKDVCY